MFVPIAKIKGERWLVSLVDLRAANIYTRTRCSVIVVSVDQSNHSPIRKHQHA